MYTRRETKRERKTEIDRQRCLSRKNVKYRLMVEGSTVGWLPVRMKILSVGVEYLGALENKIRAYWRKAFVLDAESPRTQC